MYLASGKLPFATDRSGSDLVPELRSSRRGCSSRDPRRLTWEGDRKGPGVEWGGWLAQASFRFFGQRPRGRTVTEDSTKAVRKYRSTETSAMPFPPKPLGAGARFH